MTPLQRYYLTESRREFLKHTGAGIGALGLASVLNGRLFAGLSKRNSQSTDYLFNVR